MWSPRSLENRIALWLDGDIFLGVDEDTAVEVWGDKSGLGHDAVQVTTADKPSVASTIIMGRKSVNFEDDDSEWLMTDHISEMEIGTGDFAVAVVYIQTSNDADNHQTVVQKRAYTSYGGGSAGILLRQAKESTDDNDRTAHTGSQKIIIREGTSGVPDPDAHVYLFYRVSGILYAYLDGDLVDEIISTNDMDDLQSTPVAKVSLGNLGDSTTENKVLDGFIGEVIMMPGSLSTKDRERLEGYLGHKWDLPSNPLMDLMDKFPAGHKYKSFAPSGMLGINLSAGDNPLHGRVDGELAGNVGWEISDVQEIQRG